MIRFRGKKIAVVTGDQEKVIILLPDGCHREVPGAELHDAWGQPVPKAVLELAIFRANRRIGFPWVCMAEDPPCAPCAVGGFLDREEALLYAASYDQREPRRGKSPSTVVTAAEFLRARSRWWQRRQPCGPGSGGL